MLTVRRTLRRAGTLVVRCATLTRGEVVANKDLCVNMRCMLDTAHSACTAERLYGRQARQEPLRVCTKPDVRISHARGQMSYCSFALMIND